MPFDLDAYLARIRLPARPTRDQYGLVAMQRAQRLAIPFETLDIRLGRGIRVDSDGVFAKLVTARRGGYCFEQNRLLLDAMLALGFDVRPLLARVWLDAAAEPTRATHSLLLVRIGDENWVADAGFGGSDDPPMRLVAGSEAHGPGGAAFRLVEDARGWVMQRRVADRDWVDQYSFTLAAVGDDAIADANAWASTASESPFVEHVVVRIALPTGVASMTDRHYRRYSGGAETVATIDDPRVYRLRLSMMFGIDLSAAEVAALRLF